MAEQCGNCGAAHGTDNEYLYYPAMVHGTFPRSNIYPMGRYMLPMVLSFPGLRLSHGPLLVAHGPLCCCLISVPRECCDGPWDILSVQQLSHGTLLVAHGPLCCCLMSVPWECCNGPRDILNVQHLSHGMLNVAHGPVLCCIKSVPWVTVGCPWSSLLLASYLSYGNVAMDHGTF